MWGGLKRSVSPNSKAVTEAIPEDSLQRFLKINGEWGVFGGDSDLR